MKVSFRLKFPHLKTSYIFADISVSGIRLKYSLKVSVPVVDFDPSRQRMEGTQHVETNDLLNHYESSIHRIIRELQMAKKISKEMIKSMLDNVVRSDQKEKPITELVEYAKMYKNRVCRVRKKRTLKNYQSTISRLIAYETKIGKKLTFADINHAFYHALMNYCKVELKQATNTFGSHIKHIKTWMNAATEDGLNTNIVFRSRSFTTVTETANSVYISLEELELIKKVNLEGKALDKVRDIFVVACYTGLRIGDYHKINFSNMINDNTMLKIKTEKTGEVVIIPLHPFVYTTLTKYDGNIPMISHQKFNKYVKDVVELAGITTPITFIQHDGEKVTLPKYKLVSSHCGRRSFATNAYKSGVPSISIMQITGHRSEKNFLKYIKVTKEENAKLVASHTFFKS